MNECLEYAIAHGIIDENIIRAQVEQMKKETILEQYHIWQGKDGFWRAHVPDESRPNKRRLIKKKDKESLLEALGYEHVMGLDNLRTLFPKWIEYKTLHTQSTSYIKRITASWKKYYAKDTELINKPVEDFTKLYLDKWAHNLIKTNEMTKKQYYNTTVIVRQILDYAVDEGIIPSNPFSKVKVSPKVFRREKKKKSATQVYQTGEYELIYNDMMRRFEERPNDTAPLAVLLGFETGLRIGELVSIRESDIEGNYIHIQRQEVRKFEMVGAYDMRFCGFETVEYTKSEDSDREVYLTKRAREILDTIRVTNEKYSNHCEDYIFVVGNEKIDHYAVQARILRGCKAIGIPAKTMHKVRKTYISTLIDNGVNIDEIRRMAGHSDERTTYANYCFNRFTQTETENQIENALKK